MIVKVLDFATLAEMSETTQLTKIILAHMKNGSSSAVCVCVAVRVLIAATSEYLLDIDQKVTDSEQQQELRRAYFSAIYGIVQNLKDLDVHAAFEKAKVNVKLDELLANISQSSTKH